MTRVQTCALPIFIGEAPHEAEVLAIPGAYLHMYGKAPRPGRKIGHITVRADDPDEMEAVLARVRAVVGE